MYCTAPSASWKGASNDRACAGKLRRYSSSSSRSSATVIVPEQPTSLRWSACRMDRSDWNL